MAPLGRTVVWSAVAGTVVVLALVPRVHDRLTTYAAASPRLAAADVIAAVALLVACLVGLVLQPSRPGLVALGLAAPAWTLTDWAGWYSGPDLARSIGMVLSPLLVPLLVHVVLAAAGRSLRMRAGLVALYAAAGTAALVRAVADDPFFDEACWNTCLVDNVFLVSARPDLVRGVEATWLLVTAVSGLGLVGLAIGWLASATVADRRVHGPALAAAVALGGVLLTESVLRWRRPRVDPTTSVDAALYFALVMAVVLVAVSWTYGPLLDRWTRRGVASLVTGLGSAAEAGTVARVLALATGDPGLRVVYRIPSSGGYADAAGRSVEVPHPGPGIVPLLRDGQELAVVRHDPEITTPARVYDALGTALMLALHNERLRAEGLAQLADLRASRARVVEAGDAERRQLERNLHDGAQQRMLALSFDLRRAVGAARDPAVRDVLALAETEARTALAELRDLAHGIYPAVLEEAGLAAALATLASGTPMPVEVRAHLDERLPRGVERTAYVVVRDALVGAAAIGSEEVVVTLTEGSGDLVLWVRGVGPGPFTSVEDRVAGAGGHVEVDPDGLRAVIPCE